jgi:DNA helicase-2/ATP-dependent DNA helicase PcrA
MTQRVATIADEEVRECLTAGRSFALIAGAGSGKTTSLIDALDHIRAKDGVTLRRNGQRVACITYTKRAAEIIKARIGFDDLYLVSTLHSFVWGEFGRFQHDIRESLRVDRIPSLIAKAREKDNGGSSKQARRAREHAAHLEAQLNDLDQVSAFVYDDSSYSNYRDGRLSHDDVIQIASHLLAENPTFRRLVGFRFPYIFVDEAQDTFAGIVTGLNLTCAGVGLPLAGYFGDPWQQIYEGRAGTFAPPPNGRTVTKTENFRCAKSVIRLLNAFRDDVEQYAAGENNNREGSVEFLLVQSEAPSLPRNRYSDEQIVRALARMDQATTEWGWQGRNDVIRLFLVRQMIARRLGFSAINQLFTGEFASSRAQDDYEAGEHFLLKPFISAIWPLAAAYEQQDGRLMIDLLRRESPAFAIEGPNSGRTLREMINRSVVELARLQELWRTSTVRDILNYCRSHDLVRMPEKLTEHLERQPRPEEYNDELHETDKGDWLCDAFFRMKADEIPAYCNFILKNTPFSTQHGVKGEEYPNVLVVFDDVEAAWNNYSFSKLLTPRTAGAPTDGQRDRGRKLAYVCFSRAMEHLRVLLFTPNPDAARQELTDGGLLQAEQIQVVR